MRPTAIGLAVVVMSLCVALRPVDASACGFDVLEDPGLDEGVRHSIKAYSGMYVLGPRDAAQILWFAGMSKGAEAIHSYVAAGIKYPRNEKRTKQFTFAAEGELHLFGKPVGLVSEDSLTIGDATFGVTFDGPHRAENENRSRFFKVQLLRNGEPLATSEYMWPPCQRMPADAVQALLRRQLVIYAAWRELVWPHIRHTRGARMHRAAQAFRPSPEA